MPTLDDIAKALGISKSTVSKALNNADDVGPSTRHAVCEKAVELGYTRRSYDKSVPRVAVFITNMQYQQPEDFGYDILMGFKKAAASLDHPIVTIDLSYELQNTIHYDAYMVQHNYCAGLFLGLSLRDPWLRDFKTCKTPTVLYDNHVSGNPQVTHVGVDNQEALRLSVGYLVGLGHRKIGYLGNALGAYVYQQRLAAYVQALREHGIPVEKELIGTEFRITDCLANHLPRLLERGCTALVCSHDLLASSVMISCADRGLTVPRDISILGFDDIPMSALTVPPLTTIRQDRTQIGKSAFFALNSQLNHVHVGSVLLHPALVERRSCAAPPAADTGRRL